MGLIDKLDLAKAFRRVDSDRRDDAWPDVVGYRDYKRYLGENEHLAWERVKKPKQYRTELPLSIDLPKRGLTLRPGVVPQINDRLVYQAIADLLAPHYVAEPSVYSNKLAGPDSNQMFILGVELWVDFQDKVEEYCQQYPYAVETDIASYFDHINHDLLLSRINDLFGQVFDQTTLDEIRTLLSRLWGRWSYGLKKFGIPQLNDASSFMGNLYLDELDKWFNAQRIVNLRYVDDIRMFAESEPLARKALAELIVKMREMGLYVASAKTRIRRTQDVVQELERGRKVITHIEAHIDSKDPARLQQASDLLGEFFLELVSDPNNFNDRQFRFCVNRFKRLHVTDIGQDVQDRVISEVLQRFTSMPESTDIFVDYLALFPNHERIQRAVLDFLEGPYNIYAWQEMHLLELLIRANLVPQIRTRANQFASDIIHSAKHPACKAKAYVLRGKNGTYADRRDIRARYVQEDREDLRRSIIVAIQEMCSEERDHFYRSITHDSRRIEQTITYTKALSEPTYSYYNPPSPYEVATQEDDSDDLFDLGSEYFI